MRLSLIGGALLLASLSAFAGDKGNGGYSIVCRDNGGPIVSAELLDIYEGRILFKRKYPETKMEVGAIVSAVVAKVANYNHFQEKLKKEISLIEKNIIFIPEGNELQPTDDAFPPIKKKGCEFEQVANYTNGGELLISEEIYNQFDSINKAALILHEAIYSMRRKSVGDETSQTTRRLVAQLMATEGDIEIIERWVFDSLHRPNNKFPCGTKGSIEERIESCSYVVRSASNLKLVTRTADQKEIWIDYDQKILWGDRVQNFVNFEQAQSVCSKEVFEGYEWRLPSAEEFTYHGEAFIHTLPNLSTFNHFYTYWTSSVRGRSVVTYSGENGQTGYNLFRGSKMSVRCVANLK